MDCDSTSLTINNVYFNITCDSINLANFLSVYINQFLHDSALFASMCLPTIQHDACLRSIMDKEYVAMREQMEWNSDDDDDDDDEDDDD